MRIKIRKYGLFAMLGFILLASCKKEISEGNFTLYSGTDMNDTSWSASVPTYAAINRIIDSTAVYEYKDSLIGAAGKTITFSDRLKIFFPANAFINSTGNLIPGKVEVKVLVMREKSAFIRTLKSTHNNTELLETDMGICILASSNGQSLEIAPTISYEIRLGNEDNKVMQQMRIYRGDESGVLSTQLQMDPLFNWNEASSNQFQLAIFKQPGIGGSKDIEQYAITTNQLRWILIARPMQNIGIVGKLNVILPPNFTNKNSLVFMTTDDYNLSIELKPELNSRSFSSNLVPLQKKAHLISISLIGNQFYYSETNVKTLYNTPVISLKPQKKSLNQILNELKKL
ncbi:hypothetical protein [Sediminibacterium sp.]|uniref:hypothetical protein n=1 Tax=Sediminibacterium sp. TaxID=1917865 RepID=UPI003F712D7F